MKLLDQCRQVARLRHLAYSTEKSYVHWIERFIRFHGLRHPNTMGVLEVEAFLTHLAVTDHVAASTQNQALGALLFLYRDVLKIDLGSFDAVRARKPRRIPAVLSMAEVAELLRTIDALPTNEPHGLMARLMYGAGLRLMECCRLLRSSGLPGPNESLATRCGTALPRTCWNKVKTFVLCKSCSVTTTFARP